MLLARGRRGGGAPRRPCASWFPLLKDPVPTPATVPAPVRYNLLCMIPSLWVYFFSLLICILVYSYKPAPLLTTTWASSFLLLSLFIF